VNLSTAQALVAALLACTQAVQELVAELRQRRSASAPGRG